MRLFGFLLSFDDRVFNDHEKALDMSPEGCRVEHVDKPLGKEVTNTRGGVAHGRRNRIANKGN